MSKPEIIQDIENQVSAIDPNGDTMVGNLIISTIHPDVKLKKTDTNTGGRFFVGNYAVGLGNYNIYQNSSNRRQLNLYNSIHTGYGDLKDCLQLIDVVNGTTKLYTVLHEGNISSKLDGHYVNVTGDTMTGTLHLKANQYADSFSSGALNLNNSNIYGVNAIFFQDLSDDSKEGIHFWRSSTSVDSLWGKNGVLYFTPDRTVGSTAIDYIILHSGNMYSQLDSRYVNVSGDTMTGDLSILSDGNNDRFIYFRYQKDSKGATWRIGHLATGNGDANYFVIQTTGSPTSSTTENFTNAIRIGMDTKDILLDSTTASTSKTTGALVVSGGLGVAGTIYSDRLVLTNTTDAMGTAANNVALIVGPPTGAHIEIDGNEILAKSNGTTMNNLHISETGANTYINGILRVPNNNAYFSKTLIVTANNGVSYGQGIRINGEDNKWITITLGSSGDSGTGANCWSIHRKDDNNFCISKNSSNGVNGLVMTDTGMGLGTASPSYRLHVVGNMYGSANLTIGGSLNVAGFISTLYNEKVTSGTNANRQRNSILISGPTYGNTAADIKTEGQLSWGDPGPQIIFNTSQTRTSGQPLALIYSDNNGVGDGSSLHLVSSEVAWFVAPNIKALTKFVGTLDGGAKQVYSTYSNGTNGTFYFDYHSGASSAYKDLRHNSSLYHIYRQGVTKVTDSSGNVTTAEVTGYSYLGLGNSTAYNTNGGTRGLIRMYGTGAYYHDISSEINSSNKSLVIPNYAGYLLVGNNGDTNPTSRTGYRIPFYLNNHQRTGTNDGIFYYTLEGTTSAVGNADLVIGNSIASGTAKNKRGAIYLYGTGANYSALVTNAAANRTVTIPNAAGYMLIGNNGYVNPTSSTTYYVPFYTSAHQVTSANDGLRFNTLEGTASALGYGVLILGNATTSGTAANKYGLLRLYGESSGYVQIRPGTASTANRTLYFPDTSGQFVVHTNDTAIGGAAQPVYIAASGIATACSSTVGGTAKPVYMNAGTITACSSTVGSATKPVYMNAGTITAVSYNVDSLSTTLATTTQFYLLGTDRTSTGNETTALFDTGIYSTTTAGQLSVNTLVSRSTLYAGTDIYLRNGISGTYGRFRVNVAGTAGNGTANGTQGETYLYIGNGTAISSTNGSGANNARGRILIYGTNTGYTTIIPGNNSTSNYTLTLPATTGTLLATTGNYTLTGNITLGKSTTIANDTPAKLTFSVTQTDNNTTSTGYIAVYDDHDNAAYGTNMVIQSAGNVIIGAGESPSEIYTNDVKGKTDENLYLSSDGTINFVTNCGTIANRAYVKLDGYKNFYPAINQTGSIGTSSYRWKTAYIDLTVSNRTTAGSAFLVQLNGKTAAYLSVDKIGTAGDGTNAGTTGTATLVIGNSIAVSSTDGSGANNLRGRIYLYGSNENYTVLYAQANGNRSVYLPNYDGTMYLVHGGDNNAIGTGTKPVYVAANGRVTAFSSTVGSATKPVYMNAGTITACSSTVGSASLPVYMASGVITKCTWGTFASTTENYYLMGAKNTTSGLAYNTSIYVKSSVMYGAAWNDYAEYRAAEITTPGYCVVEDSSGYMKLSTERLQPGAEIISDTFGFAIGETDEYKTPIASTGRVLAYPYEDRYSYPLGCAVCSGPNGTVSQMTREEIREYPERIIGTVSEIPEYERWGTGNIKVDGRIWIRIK